MFVPAEFHVSSDDERAEYDLHTNSPDDLGYRKFLSRLFDPIRARAAAGSCGLDFGGGEQTKSAIVDAALSLFEEVGYDMQIHDQFYAPDPATLHSEYDFVTASEVVEHFRKPAEELSKLWDCVRSGGLLGVMTKLVSGPEAFRRWHYKNDRTHVSFFSTSTWKWLAAEWQTDATFIGSDVVLLRKP